jgi:hypothetical protein
MGVNLAELGRGEAVILAGTEAPPEQIVTETVVPAHGWQILAPH